jgi:hypothetical protein
LAFHAGVLGETAAITKRLTETVGWATVSHGNLIGRKEDAMPKAVLLLAARAFVFGLMQPAAAAAAAAPGDQRQDLSAQRRPQVTIHPRHRALGPNAKRTCRAWLAREYRVSGPVIVPRQQCWWE